MPNDETSNKMPDNFDRLLGALHGLPDVVSTRESVLRVVPPLGVGGSQTFIVQTYRQKDQGDTIFLECVDQSGTVRIVLPEKVAAVIARQRDQLSAKSRSKSAKLVAQDRKDRGELPGFMKYKNKKR
jgi:hypothetical protein